MKHEDTKLLDLVVKKHREVLSYCGAHSCNDCKYCNDTGCQERFMAELLIESGHLQEPKKIGKFKDANALKQAYESLEKEYTKKCQTLAKLREALDKDEKKPDGDWCEYYDFDHCRCMGAKCAPTCYCGGLKSKCSEYPDKR